MKELAEELEKQFICFGENKKKLIKIEKKLQKLYLTYYNLLIAQDLWQANYQVLSIIFLKEFIKLKVNTSLMTKDLKLAELNISIATVFLNTQTLKMI